MLPISPLATTAAFGNNGLHPFPKGLSLQNFVRHRPPRLSQKPESWEFLQRLPWPLRKVGNFFLFFWYAAYDILTGFKHMPLDFHDPHSGRFWF